MVAESVSYSRITSKKTLESASYAKIDNNICQKARQPKRLTRFSLKMDQPAGSGAKKASESVSYNRITSRMVAESVSYSKNNNKNTSESASYAKIYNNICQKARQPKRLTRFSLKSWVNQQVHEQKRCSVLGARCPVHRQW